MWIVVAVSVIVTPAETPAVVIPENSRRSIVPAKFAVKAQVAVPVVPVPADVQVGAAAVTIASFIALRFGKSTNIRPLAGMAFAVVNVTVRVSDAPARLLVPELRATPSVAPVCRFAVHTVLGL